MGTGEFTQFQKTIVKRVRRIARGTKEFKQQRKAKPHRGETRVALQGQNWWAHWPPTGRKVRAGSKRPVKIQSDGILKGLLEILDRRHLMLFNFARMAFNHLSIPPKTFGNREEK